MFGENKFNVVCIRLFHQHVWISMWNMFIRVLRLCILSFNIWLICLISYKLFSNNITYQIFFIYICSSFILLDVYPYQYIYIHIFSCFYTYTCMYTYIQACKSIYTYIFPPHIPLHPGFPQLASKSPRWGRTLPSRPGRCSGSLRWCRRSRATEWDGLATGG